ncbi:hypothetical protein H8B02_40880 [Bradyrhizobium sp. Pear77]|uniref:ATP-binding protein n=1 Tax=Bradyrhizobium altum TaxID=1571202 RepID=UPI001E2DF103|nr:ATP-binding protein [Bradyrhizobium altum]MCC8959539.1 hypothetical protein [Bradyrhizobium altum]
MNGNEEIEVHVPGHSELAAAARGTPGMTGGGKSTTVSRAARRLGKAGNAAVLFNIEDEYAAMNEETKGPCDAGWPKGSGAGRRQHRTLRVVSR